MGREEERGGRGGASESERRERERREGRGEVTRIKLFGRFFV